MASVSQLPSSKWRAQIRRKGLATIGKVFDTREEAVAWGSAREAELVGAKAAAVGRPEAGITFNEVLDRYYMSSKYTDKASGTQKRELVSAKRLKEHFGSYMFSTITGAMVQNYLDLRSNEKVRKNGQQLDRKVSADTVRLEKAFLMTLFNFAKRRDLIVTNIMRDSFDMKTCYPREARITQSQQLRLYEAAEALSKLPNANQSLLPWLEFCMETGSRPGEAAKMQLRWVNLEERSISIPRLGSKKRNPRIILLTEEMAETIRQCVIRAQAAGSKYVFFSRAHRARAKDARGKPIRRLRDESDLSDRPCIPFSYYSGWRKVCEDAGVKDINPHIMRHEVISRLFESTDLNDSQIAALVGDVNVLSLAPYKHLRVGKLRGRQDAHIAEQRAAMDAIRVKTRAAEERFSEHGREMLKEAREEREAAGDFTTPMQRIRAMQDPKYAAELAAKLRPAE